MGAERLELGIGQDKSENGTLANLWKYFAHGLVVALIMLGFPFFMDMVLLGAIYGGCALLGGLVLVFIMLLFGVGFFNSHLARYLWNLNPKRTLTSWLGQGILVLLMLPLFGSIYYMIIMLLWGFASPPAILSAVVLFFLDAIASGYIGRHVAAEFEEQREGVEELASVADRHIPCPHCGSLFICRSSMIGPNGNATCPHCRGAVVVPVEGPRPEYSDWERKPERDKW
jgi:hypothetical protein